MIVSHKNDDNRLKLKDSVNRDAEEVKHQIIEPKAKQSPIV